MSDLLFYLAALVCTVAQIAVVRSALAGRTPGSSAFPLARAREFFWVVLPAALLVFVFVWTWQSLPGRTSDHSQKFSPVSRASATDRSGPVGQLARHPAVQPEVQPEVQPADVQVTA